MEIPVSDPTVVIYAIGYLWLFRLSIVLLGAVSIFLGYRLFVDAMGKRHPRAENTQLSGKIGESEFTLKNAAPGTFFAAFGALITIVVLATNPAEFTRTERQPSAANSGQPQTSAPISRERVTTVRAESGNTGDVLASGTAAHDRAIQYLDKALEQAEKAVQSEPGRADFHNTLAALYFAADRPTQAIDAQKEAVRLAPEKTEFQQRLEAYKTAAGVQ